MASYVAFLEISFFDTYGEWRRTWHFFIFASLTRMEDGVIRGISLFSLLCHVRRMASYVAFLEISFFDTYGEWRRTWHFFIFASLTRMEDGVVRGISLFSLL